MHGGTSQAEVSAGADRRPSTLELAHTGSIVMERVSVVGHGTEGSAHSRGTRTYVQKFEGTKN